MFFARIEKLFECESFAAFHDDFLDLYDDFKSHKIDMQDNLYICDARYFCQKFLSITMGNSAQIFHPTKIRRPNHAKTPLAVAKILHSVTHIEACAILLALDSAYRFRNLPFSFYQDWLEVAQEEIRHFCMLLQLLQELDAKYGDFRVHTNLFDALIATQCSLEIRMGVVHRGLEARGLDANPFVLEKLMQTSLGIKSKIKETFGVILSDEIAHVCKGDRWWKYSASMTFLELCQAYSQFTLAGHTLHIPARLKAGFLMNELESLQKFYGNCHQNS